MDGMKAWAQTLNGRAFDLLDPTPDMADWPTVAAVLARVPRFGGHTSGGVLSVAQHCEQGARAVWKETGRRDWAAAFLLHDAHEAYIGDIATPVAVALASLGTYGSGVRNAIRELKRRIDEAIYTAAGIEWPLPSEVFDVVKVYDTRMLRTERDARLAPPPVPWGDEYERGEPIADVDCSVWPEELARALYKTALFDFCGIRC